MPPDWISSLRTRIRWPFSATCSAERSIWASTMSVTALAAAVEGLVASARIWPAGHSPAKAGAAIAKVAARAVDVRSVRTNMEYLRAVEPRPERSRRRRSIGARRFDLKCRVGIDSIARAPARELAR